jgi:1,4-dihydroxy-2-naphthoyl-CoA hydrolase
MDGRLPGLLGLELIAVAHGAAELRMDVRPEFLAPNDFLHAGAIVTLADTACGMGCLASLPDRAAGFTTIELKSNFLRSARAGEGLRCRASLAHSGQTTQVWDALVARESDSRDLAMFRCTQYLLPATDDRTERQAELRG